MYTPLKEANGQNAPPRFFSVHSFLFCSVHPSPFPVPLPPSTAKPDLHFNHKRTPRKDSRLSLPPHWTGRTWILRNNRGALMQETLFVSREISAESESGSDSQCLTGTFPPFVACQAYTLPPPPGTLEYCNTGSSSRAPLPQVPPSRVFKFTVIGRLSVSNGQSSHLVPWAQD